MSKDFSNTNADPVFNAISNATAEPTKSTPAGKKVVMSIGIDAQARDYLQTMANILGMNYSEFINTLLHEHAKKNATVYKKAREAQRKAREAIIN